MSKENQARQLLKIWRENPIKFVKDVFNVEPDEWQCDVLMDFAKYNRIAMKASKGVGKEQPYSTPTPTPLGYKLFGDLAVGDLIFGDDGNPTKVLHIFEQGEKDVYEITFDDGLKTKCGLDHLWKVRGISEKRKKTWSVISTKEIIQRGLSINLGKCGEYFQFQIPNCKPVFYNEKKYSLHPYALGIWLGDGSKKSACYTKKNPEIADILNNFGVDTVKNKTKFKYTMSNIQQKLRDLLLFDKNSHQRFIPEPYKYGSIKQRLHLLQGLMDSDGTAKKNSPTTEFSTTSKALAQDVVYLARSLGAKSWIRKKIKKGKYKKDGKIVIAKDCYRVNITIDINPFLAKQKAQLWRKPKQERYLFKTIKKIEKVGVENSRCIMVDNDSNCYLTNDYIVTHNSTILSWCAWNFLVTRPHPKIAATSISFDNLADGLWTEMAKWRGVSQLLQYQFEWTKTRIFSKEHPETWYMSARTYPKTGDSNSQANTLAGLHADYLLFILDEVGGIPDGVMAAAEAGLASGVETKIIMAGNPTHLEGPLYRAVTSEKHLWKVTEITSDPDNPKRSPRVSMEWAKEQREKYGSDSPWYVVNVLGKFPPSSINSLLGPDEVNEAMRRQLSYGSYEYSQKRLGVDVARFGMDRTVIFPRQGLRAFKPVVMNGADTLQIVSRIMESKSKWGSEADFVDGTGGFGAGVVDLLRQQNVNVFEVHFSGKPNDPRFLNKRAEMWFKMAEWVKKGGSLPNMPELARELTAPQYTFVNGKFQLEPKENIRERLGFSPDCFVDGTLIKTDKGLIPIEKLKTGDIVFTPLGNQKIIKVWESYTDQLTIASFSNGQTLKGKGTHGIFTWNKGFVKMSELQKDSCIESVSKVSILKWEILNLLFTKKKNIIFKQAVDITQKGTSQSPIKSELDFYTEGFGLSAMVLFLKVFIFIISMAIGAITALRTLKLFVVKSISLVICLIDLLIKTIKRILLKISMTQGILQASGTEAVKELRGIGFMVKKHGKIEKQKNRFVMYAERFMRLIFQVGQNFVQSLASKSKDIKIKQKQLFVSFAEQKKKFINMIRGNSALISVRQDHVHHVKVYNLTLDKHNVYYANGILVANCADSLALTFTIPERPSNLYHSLTGQSNNVGKLKTDPD